MSEAKSVESLSYYTTSVGLVYVVIGLLSEFGMVYVQVTGGSISGTISAHNHFLCMSILILIVGLAMKNWAREIREGRFTISGGQLKSAEASAFMLALGAIIAFIFHLAQISLLMGVGDVIFFVGFLMVAIGWIMGGRKMK